MRISDLICLIFGNDFMIDTILWDVDGTLLDFHAAEYAAVKSLFAEFGYGECSDDMTARYSEINDSFWKRLERGEITKAQVLIGRFEQFFSEYGISTEGVYEFNEKYQPRLGDTIVYCDDSYNIVKSLKGKVRQYAVSNGTVAAQTEKMKRSGFGELLDGVFLSENIGSEKPNIGFFEKVFEKIQPVDKSKTIIVGDSLTSDMQGGINAGIKTCLYAPKEINMPENMNIDYVIKDLGEILDIIKL